MSDQENNITFVSSDLLSITKLRIILKDFKSEQLELLSNKLSKLIEEVKIQEKLEKELEAKKQKAIDEVLNLIKSKGISLEEVCDQVEINKNKKYRGGREFYESKYVWTNADGTVEYWSGQGVIPKNLKIVMERDGITDKSAYLINKPETN